MAKSPTLARAVRAVDEAGILLVYPLANRPEPPSLWSVLHPRTPMRWAWDDSADGRVVELWQLREELARSRRVVYAKWFRGRATFFSRSVFTAMLARMITASSAAPPLSGEARTLLDLLEESSPRSTKELRREADLQGRMLEGIYTRAMRELWTRLLAVGMGEIDDGAFPSLAVGATRLVFEDLWDEATALAASDPAESSELDDVLASHPVFLRAWKDGLRQRPRTD